MYKEQFDELYHLLREVSNEATPEVPAYFYGLSRHLLAGGDYLALVQYCAYYGEKFLLQPTFEAILERNWKPARIVELGAGLGWLCRGLAVKFGIADTLTVDKRAWGGIDVVADLEFGSGMRIVDEHLKEGDIIVMSDFLHCVDNPEGILKVFSKYPMAILDYMPVNQAHAASYEKQLTRYGGSPIHATDVLAMLSELGRLTDIKDLEPYMLILIDKEE